MEHVSGVPITEYCDRNGLSTRARLELFVLACGAFEHAHQKGIIHRDVKPQNILVTVQDGRPVPKVIDFGVAKATRQKLTEKTVFTHLGLLIGTPAYMSPEQAELGGVDITTATDVYSLGVLLYELLVSALPFDPAALQRAGYGEIQRIIREQEPVSPSVRLSALGAKATSIAQQRHTDVAALIREIKGDLDWIVLKALEKTPDRRYSSASDLAADVSRYLQSDRVLARRFSFRRRLRRIARLHPVRARLAALFSVLMLALVTAIAWMWTSAPGVSLTVTKPAGGTVIGGGLVCGTHGTICATSRAAGDVIELYPVADPGYVFAGFVGDCGPAGQIRMKEASTCGATFRQAEPVPTRATRVLTVTKPSGGTIVSAIGIFCGTLGALCSANLDEGLPVTLRALPDADYRLVQFTGACATGGETKMSEDRICGAAFTLSPNRADSPATATRGIAPQSVQSLPMLPDSLRISARPGEPEKERASREKIARSQLEVGRNALADGQFDGAITAFQSALATSGRADYGVQPNEAAMMLRQARNGKAAVGTMQRNANARRLVEEARALANSNLFGALQKLHEARSLDPEVEGAIGLIDSLIDQARIRGESALTSAKDLDRVGRIGQAIQEYERAVRLLEVVPGEHKDLASARVLLAALKLLK